MTLFAQPADGFLTRSEGVSLLMMRSVAKRRSRRSSLSCSRGFSLVELLVVLAIVAILSSILALSIFGTKSSRDVANAAYSIQGVLEQARTFAMASNTYTWVGFFEENPASPGTAGVGQLVISVISSQDGTKLYTPSTPPATPSPAVLPSASLNQVAKLLKVPGVHPYTLTIPTTPATPPTFSTRPSPTYQLGSTSGASLSSSTSGFSSAPTFTYPLTGTAVYTFSNIIQFSPQGDATRIDYLPAQLIEIGLCPAHGNVASLPPPAVPGSSDDVAIQIAGIGGHVTTYKP